MACPLSSSIRTGPDSSGPPCSGVQEGVLRFEHRLWRRLQWLITQQSTHPSCPLRLPLKHLHPHPSRSLSPCPLSSGADSWHAAPCAHTRRSLTEEKRFCFWGTGFVWTEWLWKTPLCMCVCVCIDVACQLAYVCVLPCIHAQLLHHVIYYFLGLKTCGTCFIWKDLSFHI